MRRTFRDDQTERQFQKLGYARIQVLDAPAIAEVTALYDELDCDLKTGWHADLFSSNLGYRRQVHERVGPIFRERVLPLLDDHRHVSSIFVVKEKSSVESKVPMHQDWTVVDNARFASANMVCPLVDMTAENGWLLVVPGSHKAPNRISFAPSDRLVFDGDWEQMTPYLQPLDLKAGEAIIYDGRLLHGSPPNRSPNRRLAFSAGFLPREAELRQYYQDPGRLGELEVLALPPDFFLTHRLGERPDSISRGFIPHSNPSLTENQLRSWVQAALS